MESYYTLEQSFSVYRLGCLDPLRVTSIYFILTFLPLNHTLWSQEQGKLSPTNLLKNFIKRPKRHYIALVLSCYLAILHLAIGSSYQSSLTPWPTNKVVAIRSLYQSSSIPQSTNQLFNTGSACPSLSQLEAVIRAHWFPNQSTNLL